MATVSGLGTTFNLPNYHGELIGITPTDTPLLSAAGGISEGGGQTTSPAFEWQTEDLRAPEIRARLEGADAPTAEERSRSNINNVCQIFQEAISTSYTKQAAIGQYTGTSSSPYLSRDGIANPVADEHGHQVANALKTIARDVNFAFWHGVKNVPASNSTARQMDGILNIVTGTNRVATGEVVDASASGDTITGTHAYVNGDKIVFTDVGASTTVRPDTVYYVVSISTTVSHKVSATLGGAAITVGTATVSTIKAGTTLTLDIVNGFLQAVFDNGGISEQDTAALFVSSRQKRALSAVYAAAYGQASPVMGNVGGVVVERLATDFGTLNVAIDRALAADTIALVSLEQVSPVFLEIPGKGVLFEEELARTGASIKSQVYGEIGLKYGNPYAHGSIRGLAV